MKKIVWDSSTRKFSTQFERDLQERLDILNKLNKKSGLPELKATYFGTATQRQQLEITGQTDKILDELDHQILMKEQELNRTIINPSYKG